jgi:tetratricopeptide (TPR) repeat protein
MKKGILRILAVLLLGIVFITLSSLFLTHRQREQKSSQLRELFLDGDHEAVIELSAEHELSQESLYLAGLSRYALGEYEQAVRKLELYLVLYGQDAYVNRVVGLAYKQLEKYGQASVSLEKAERTPEVLAHLLVCYTKLGDADALEKTIRELGLHHTEAVLYSVEALASLSEYARAVGILEDAHIEGYVPYIVKRAELHMLQGDSAAALPIIQKALTGADMSDRQRSQLFVLLGDIYYDMGRLVEARNAWKQAAEFDISNTAAQQRL